MSAVLASAQHTVKPSLVDPFTPVMVLFGGVFCGFAIVYVLALALGGLTLIRLAVGIWFMPVR